MAELKAMEQGGVPFYGLNLSVGLSVRIAGFGENVAAGLLGEHAMAADFGECWRAIEWMGLQRHLKILGIFCRLKHRDGKPHYAEDLPRFFNRAAQPIDFDEYKAPRDM